MAATSLLYDKLLAVLDQDALGVLAHALAGEVVDGRVGVLLLCGDVADAGGHLHLVERRLDALLVGVGAIGGVLGAVLHVLVHGDIGDLERAVAIGHDGEHVAVGAALGDVEAVVRALHVQVFAVGLLDGVAAIDGGELKFVAFLRGDDVIVGGDIGDLQVSVGLGERGGGLQRAVGVGHDEVGAVGYLRHFLIGCGLHWWHVAVAVDYLDGLDAALLAEGQGDAGRVAGPDLVAQRAVVGRGVGPLVVVLKLDGLDVLRCREGHRAAIVAERGLAARRRGPEAVGVLAAGGRHLERHAVDGGRLVLRDVAIVGQCGRVLPVLCRAGGDAGEHGEAVLDEVECHLVGKCAHCHQQ